MLTGQNGQLEESIDILYISVQLGTSQFPCLIFEDVPYAHMMTCGSFRLITKITNPLRVGQICVSELKYKRFYKTKVIHAHGSFTCFKERADITIPLTTSR